MSNLLVITRRRFQEMEKKPGAVPVELHGQVLSETAPFLVTKAKGGVLWVDESPTGVIRAGVCNASPGRVFLNVVDAVVERGADLRWGNVHAYTLEGVKAAADYLRSFDLMELELLVPRIRLPKHVHPKVNKELKKTVDDIMIRHSVQQGAPIVARPPWMNPDEVGFPICPTSWLPDGYAVVVPAERAYVGELTHLAVGYVAAIIHNPSRGIAVARGKPK